MAEGWRMEATSERGLFGSLMAIGSWEGDRELRERGKLWETGELREVGGAELAE